MRRASLAAVACSSTPAPQHVSPVDEWSLGPETERFRLAPPPEGTQLGPFLVRLENRNGAGYARTLTVLDAQQPKPLWQVSLEGDPFFISWAEIDGKRSELATVTAR